MAPLYELCACLSSVLFILFAGWTPAAIPPSDSRCLLPLVAMLTYKSIDEAIKAHDGIRLYRLLPPESADEGRTIYVMSGLLGVLSDFDDSRDGLRHEELRVFLDHFSSGGHLTVSQHPHAKPGHVALSRVHPTDSEVWSLRCLHPPQGMRVLGRFAAKDCFIALDWNYREILDEEDGWDNAIRDCQSVWRELFGDLPPLQGSHVREYLSSNVEDVPANPWRKGAKRNA